MDISEITATHLQDEIVASIIIEEYREQVTKRMKDDQNLNILAGYIRSILQYFESYLRTELDLVKDDIGLVLDEHNSSFITYESDPGTYVFKDLSEFVFNILQPKYEASSNVIVIEFDVISMKKKLVAKAVSITKRFDENSFFKTILGFTSGWDYKHYIEYTSQKIVNLSTTNKIHLKCIVNEGSLVYR